MTRPPHPVTKLRAELPPFAFETGLPCRDVNPELFFPTSTGPGGTAAAVHAKAVCALCPYKDPCAAWATSTRQAYGIWGGTTPPERLARRRRTA